MGRDLPALRRGTTRRTGHRATLSPAIRGDILDGLQRQTWDAVYLSLHGAMITGGNPTPELDLLAEVRGVIGNTPLAVTLRSSRQSRAGDDRARRHRRRLQDLSAYRHGRGGARSALAWSRSAAGHGASPSAPSPRCRRSIPASTCAPPTGRWRRWPSWRPNGAPSLASWKPPCSAASPMATHPSPGRLPWSSPMATARWRSARRRRWPPRWRRGSARFDIAAALAGRRASR